MSFLEYFGAAWELAKKAQIVEIQSALLDMREEFNNAREENQTLKGRITELEENLRKAQGGVFFRKPWYYTTSAQGVEDGPFCPVCHDRNNGQLIRAHEYSNEFTGSGLKCPVCNFTQELRGAWRNPNDHFR